MPAVSAVFLSGLIGSSFCYRSSCRDVMVAPQRRQRREEDQGRFEHVQHDNLPTSAGSPGVPVPRPWRTNPSPSRAASGRLRTVRAAVYAPPATGVMTVPHRYGTAEATGLSGSNPATVHTPPPACSPPLRPM